MQQHMGFLQSRGFTVDKVAWDGEAKGLLALMPNLVVHPPGTHVGRAERAIRTIKNYLRAQVIAKPSLPWFGRFLTEAVATCALLMNIQLSKLDMTLPPPITLMTGMVVDVERDFPADFGDCVLVEVNLEPMEKKTMVPRMEEAIALRPAMDLHHSHWVWLAGSGAVVKRTNLKRIVMPEWVILRLHEWSGKNRVTNYQVVFEYHDKASDIMVMDADLPAEGNVVTVEQYAEGLPATRNTAGLDQPVLTPVEVVHEQEEALIRDGGRQDDGQDPESLAVASDNDDAESGKSAPTASNGL